MYVPLFSAAYFIYVFFSSWFVEAALPWLKFVSVLPDVQLAPGYRFVGAALEYGVKKAVAEYEGSLNISVVAQAYIPPGFSCTDYDYGAIVPIAKEFWKHRYEQSDVCMTVLQIGKADQL